MHYKIAVFSESAEQAERFMRMHRAVDPLDFDAFDPAYCEWEIADEDTVREAEETIAREKSDEFTLEVFAREMERYREDFPDEDFDECVRCQFEARKADDNDVASYMEEEEGMRWCDRIHAYARMLNPHEICDWYVFGGRFTDGLLLKPGCSGEDAPRDEYSAPKKAGYCDRARLCDIRFDADEKIARLARRAWEVNVEGDALLEDDDKDEIERADTDLWDTKEDYVEYWSRPSADSYIDPDGKYHETRFFNFGVKGADGTYHLRDEFAEMLKKNPELLVTIYDIHV